ncbi:MAG: type II toxin-antitoxin system PemK/MazF family toxin [Acidimicrobiia bacterium]|nr:type II toxin-antitoxin system PemK/MazF family toxin [Acidimicrobiia bacterium]MYJ62603.1 type II toxin-antitoxin system PemK/MazF family toxin [Acidimicrobiia bacterium]
MLMMRLCSMRRQAMLLMQAGDIVRCDFGTPARGEPGFIRPAIIITSDDVLEFRQHAIVVVPCTTTKRGWLSEVAIGGFGVAQAHLPTTISVDRVVESTGTNVGFVALQQIRELIADLLGL